MATSLASVASPGVASSVPNLPPSSCMNKHAFPSLSRGKREGFGKRGFGQGLYSCSTARPEPLQSHTLAAFSVPPTLTTLRNLTVLERRLSA